VTRAAEKMIGLAPVLEREHDFTAFAASDDRDELELSKVRTILARASSSKVIG